MKPKKKAENDLTLKTGLYFVIGLIFILAIIFILLEWKTMNTNEGYAFVKL